MSYLVGSHLCDVTGEALREPGVWGSGGTFQRCVSLPVLDSKMRPMITSMVLPILPYLVIRVYFLLF